MVFGTINALLITFSYNLGLSACWEFTKKMFGGAVLGRIKPIPWIAGNI